MANIEFTALISEIRGKLDDVVFSRNRSGPYVRTLGGYTDAGSAAQLQIREYMSRGVQFWQRMQPATRKAWQMQAIRFEQHMNHFRKGTHAGYNYFLHYFMKRCIADGFPFNNIVKNSGFDSQANWSRQAGWSIAGGKATHTLSAESYIFQPALKQIRYNWFHVQLDVDSLSGSQVFAFFSGAAPTGIYTGNNTGTFSAFLQCVHVGAREILIRNLNNISCTIDNVYVCPVDIPPPADTL